MTARCDLAVIGAGPAGLAAANQAAGLGLAVCLIDEQAEPGGQIWRGGFARSPQLDAILGADYARRDAALAALTAAKIDFRPRQTLIALQAAKEGADLLLQGPDETLTRLAARRVILATGAQERPWAFLGWELPGVIGLGAAQALLKSSGLVPEGPVVIAGSGPLLYLAALQLHLAGAAIAAVLDTTPEANYRAALPLLPGALTDWPQLLKGLRMIAALKRVGIPLRRIPGLRAHGDGRLQMVRAGRYTIPAAHLLVHQGVIPQMQIARALGLAEAFDAVPQAARPETDRDGISSLPWLGIAGDGGGIIGAAAAELSGQLAALAAAHRLDRITDGAFVRRAQPLRQALARNAALRRFLDTLHAPAYWTRAPLDDEALVCRCEEVPFGALREAVRLGATGCNQAKAYTRCGMGPCQGRVCGPVVAQGIAALRGVEAGSVAPFRARFPLKPVTVGALAALEDGP